MVTRNKEERRVDGKGPENLNLSLCSRRVLYPSPSVKGVALLYSHVLICAQFPDLVVMNQLILSATNSVHIGVQHVPPTCNQMQVARRQVGVLRVGDKHVPQNQANLIREHARIRRALATSGLSQKLPQLPQNETQFS